jgi:hypothetical protein
LIFSPFGDIKSDLLNFYQVKYLMKNLRYLKNLGLYTPDMVCIGRGLLKNSPTGSWPSTHISYYQPESNKIIVVYNDETYEIKCFDNDFGSFYRIQTLTDFKYRLYCYIYADYTKIFKLRLKFIGIRDFKIRYGGFSEDDFGYFDFTFKSLDDVAIFKLYFSEFFKQ